MSKKAQKAYLALSTALAEQGEPPICSEPQYRDWFFPDGFIPIKGMSSAAHLSRLRLMEMAAKQLCNDCPLKALCAEYAITAHEEFGIWGSTSPADRKAIYASARANALGVTATPRLFD